MPPVSQPEGFPDSEGVISEGASSSEDTSSLAPRSFPLKALRNVLSQPTPIRPLSALSSAGSNDTTFPALLTVWAAGSLLLRRRSTGRNNAPNALGITVSPDLEASLLSKFAQLDAQVQALQSQQQQLERQQVHGPAQAELVAVQQALTTQQQEQQEQVLAQQALLSQQAATLDQLSKQLGVQQAQETQLQQVQDQHAAELQKVQERLQAALQQLQVQQAAAAEQAQQLQVQLEAQQAQHQQLQQQVQAARPLRRQSSIPKGPRTQLNRLAVRTMAALGIDLMNPKYKPGLETSLSALTTLSSGKLPKVPEGPASSKGGSAAAKRPAGQTGNPVSRKHQPGLVAATSLLSSLSMLLRQDGHEHGTEQPGIEAGSYALAALCCDSLSTAKGNESQMYSQAMARAAHAVAEKGVDPSDEVHKPGMLSAVSVLAVLGGLRPPAAVLQAEDEEDVDGLFFQDQAATVDALIELSSNRHELAKAKQAKGENDKAASLEAASVQQMLANRLVNNVGGNFKPPKPDPLDAAEQEEDEGPSAVDTVAVAACSARVAAVEAQVAESQAQLTCALKALRISAAEAAKDPEGAALSASVAADADGCEKLAAQQAAVQAEIAALGAQLRASQQAAAAALQALGIGQDAAEREPEAAAANATPAQNKQACKKLARQHTELNEHVHGIDKQLKDIEAGLTVALMALKIDKENAARDPEAAAAAANLLSNGMLFKELSEKLKELQEQQDQKHAENKDATSTHILQLESQLEGMQAGVQCALAALDVDPKAASLNPKAAAKTANTCHISALSQDLPKKVQELQAGLEKAATTQQLAELQGHVDATLDALGIDKAELLADPEAAVLSAIPHTTLTQLRDLSKKVNALEMQKGPGQEMEAGGGELGDIKEALAEVGTRLDTLEDKSALVEPGIGSKGIRPADLKNMECHLLDRLEEQARSSEHLSHVVEIIVADANKLASLHGMHPPAQGSAMSTLHIQPFTITSVMQKYITYDGILERFAQNRNLKEVAAKTHEDTTICLKAMKELETKFDVRNEAFSKVLVKIAAQVDFLHNKIRDVASGKTDKATINSSMPPLTKTASGRPSLLSLGTLGRSNSIRGLLDYQKKGDSPVEQALHDYEAEAKPDLKRDSGGSHLERLSSSSSTKKSGLGWDLLKKYRASKRITDSPGTPTSKS